MILPLLDDFLLNLKTQNYSEETIYNYDRDLRVFDQFLQESPIPFEKVDKKVINQYKAYLISRDRKTAKEEESRKRLSSFSINRMLSSLRSYLKFLIEMDYKTPVPPEAVKLTKTERKIIQVPEIEELIKLIEAPSSLETNPKVALRNRVALEVLFATGMRISELLSLNRGQLDESGRLFVRGKGKKERFVYLTPRARRHLEKYLATRKDNAPAIFIPYMGRNINSRDRRLSNNYLQAKIKAYREKLRINIPISAHSLRHGFATYLAESGASPAAIQILLGHESLETTTRYVHASDRFAEETHRKYHPLKESK